MDLSSHSRPRSCLQLITTDRGKISFLHWSFTGNTNHTWVGPGPRTRWLAQNEVSDVFEDVMSPVG